MNTKKINLLPLDESLEENFLNEKCNILLNNGNELLIDRFESTTFFKFCNPVLLMSLFNQLV